MVERRDVQLAVEAGDHLRGWLFWPEAGKAQHPAVSMAHGYAGVKECGLERFAQSFAEAGFVVLVHDHRNFGASDGAIRHDIDPWRQIADWRGADALLVDTFLSAAQTAELADWIAGSGKRLATIYITHAYPDHFFGVKPLRDRFPEAQAIAPPQVVDAMQAALAPEAVENWRRRFPGLIPSELATAERLDGGTFDLEGREIVPIDIGHTDTDHTTCLHLPSIGLVIAGGAIYNSTHPYLVESNRQGLGDWLAAIDKIQALNPCAVVVGHGPMEPDNAPRHIQETRHYIKDFIRLDDETRTAQELYDRMLALYPDRINPGSLWGSANAAKASRRAVPWRDDAVVTPQTPPRIHRGWGPSICMLVREELPCAANFADVTTAIAECHGVCSRCAYSQSMRSGRGPESLRITRYPKRAPQIFFYGLNLDSPAGGPYRRSGSCAHCLPSGRGIDWK